MNYGSALNRELEQLRQQLREMSEAPGFVRFVTAVGSDRVTIASILGPMEVMVPSRVISQLRPGMAIRTNITNHTFIDIAKVDIATGSIRSAIAPSAGGYVEVAFQDGTIRIRCNESVVVKAGDRVVIDPSMSVVLANLGRPTDLSITDKDTFGWDDIVGLEVAKREVRDAVEGPIRHKAMYAKFKASAVGGILLSGPPGNGKSLLAKAAASSLRATHGATGASGFIYVKGPEILSKYVGASEGNVREIFTRARTHKKEHGFPAVVFVDEADAVLTKRGTAVSSDMDRTIVPQFLAEMDGIDESGALVILATNRPDKLDPAVVRRGRIDRKIHVGRPSKDDAAAIIAMGLKGRPTDSSPKELASKAVAAAFDPKKIVRRIGAIDVPLSAIMSGAIAAGIAEQAVASALRRAIDGGSVGVTPEDAVGAVDAIVEENRSIDLGDDVAVWAAEQATAAK